MAKFPSKVTTDNVDKAVAFVKATDASFTRKNLIKKIVRPISSILFCFLSFLLVFGAIYNASVAEDMIVYDKLAFLVKAWKFVAGTLTKPDMPWFMFWGVLVAATYIIPLVVSAVVSILVTISVKGKEDQFDNDTEAVKAKKLYAWSEEVKGKSFNYEGDSLKIAFRWIFVLAIAAFLIYAGWTLKLLKVTMLLGFVVAMAILYFLYGLLFGLFASLNKLFYKKRSFYGVVDKLEEYWVSVDPQEQERRNREAEQRRKQAEHNTTTTTSASTNSEIDEYNSFTWNYGYVRDNETRCCDVSLTVLKVSKELLEEQDYSGAAAGFDKVVHALEILITIDESYYIAPLFANCYALSRIFAFGLGNKASALKYAEKACEYAIKCNTDTAKRDFCIMSEYRDALRSSQSLGSIEAEFGTEFPLDIITSD